MGVTCPPLSVQALLGWADEFMLQLPVELQPLEGRVWSERVVLPAPTIGQDLSFWGCGEKLNVEELIPEPVVERLRKAVLPRGSWLDVSRAGGATGLTPVPQSLRNGLRPVSDRMNAGAG
jgi:hypothetical protein